MRLVLGLMSLSIAAGLCASPALAATTKEERSKACWAQADKKQLKDAARTTFHSKCIEGALAPAKPNTPPGGLADKAVTSPSGNDRTTRSKQCSVEADRRKLPERQRDGFRLACLASAAPVSAIGVRQEQPTPTPAKDELGGLTSGPPQGVKPH